MKYLQTRVNGLTADEASEYIDNGWIAFDNPDGTWSAVLLVDSPVQIGQAPWTGRTA